MKVYYWLFTHSNNNRFTLWVWRKWAGAVTIIKYIQRRNWKQSKVWIKWLFT